MLKIEHSRLSSLYEYWVNQCGNTALPCRRNFDVVDLAPWLGHLMIVRPINDGKDFLYKLHGTALVGIVGEDLTGKALSSLEGDDRRGHVARQYKRVHDTGCPEYKVSDSPFEKNYKTINKLILPVANDGKQVDCLIVGVYGDINWATRGRSDISDSFSPTFHS